MITIKVYKYDSSASGYKGEDLSSYVLQGMQDTEKLNNELDITELTLQGYTYVEEFPPEYKLIIELWEDGVLVNRIDRIVQNDTVTKPILSKNYYYTHNITLIEPSAVAQKRIVDNISVTYKLKDVSLATQTTLPTSESMKYTDSNKAQLPIKDFYFTSTQQGTFWSRDCAFGKYIKWENPMNGATPYSGLIMASNSDGSYVQALEYLDLANFPNNKLKLLLPKPAIMYGVTNTSGYIKSGYASVKITVNEIDGGGYLTNNSWTKTYLSNSDLSTYCAYPYENEITASESSNKANWILEYCTWQQDNSRPNMFFKKYSGSESGNTTDIPIDFPTYGNLYIDNITMVDTYSYEVKIELYNYSDALPFAQDSYIVGMQTRTKAKTNNLYAFCEYKERYQYDSASRSIYFSNWVSNATPSLEDNKWVKTGVKAYTTSTRKQVFTHSNPYSALTLIQKAILNTNIRNKVDGIPSNNINYVDNNGVHSYDCPFYIDDNFIDTLYATQINENFYSQKNLWEVLTEVGYYIHAIPEIKFGENDKFLITFNKLGETKRSEDKATKSNITNFRGIDDYICATHSYIANMVQLGGYIEEMVAPKTSSEQYLVYNDTVEIQTTKPIIELLSIKMIPIKNITFDNISGTYPVNNLVAGTEYDITKFIYEKNVYQILSIYYADNPNKGISLYYDLGTNKIVGGQYQLPQANNNMYSDYAIKKIAFLSNPLNEYRTDWATIPDYGPWKDVCINDFVFKVKYRTKDDVRQQHTRPDLRKYLLNSKFDKAPQHNQINNQTDTLVDSEAFGENMFGKLIRTGNTEYSINEWVSSLNDLKHKGELYTINGENLYVAKVVNMFFTDHIVSQVTYSKDYNQLSQIIGIPSEPRFYEISEQSAIRRDVNIDDYVLITTSSSDITSTIASKNSNILDYSHILSIIGLEGQVYPKWVITTFKGDNDIGLDSTNFGARELYVDIMTPINTYCSGNTLTYEWDMVDNFGAGDKLTNKDYTLSSTANNTYRSLQAVQYCDQYGKATLMDFYIFDNDYEPSKANECQEIMNLPQSPINTKSGMVNRPFVAYTNRIAPYNSSVSGYDANLHKNGLILLKDCREEISINYNLQLITENDNFVTSPFIFKDNKTNVKLVLLNKSVDKMSDGFIDTSTIVNAKDTNNNYMGKYLTITFDGDEVQDPFYNSGTVYTNFQVKISNALQNLNQGHFNSSDYERIKAIALVCDLKGDSDTNKKRLILARNIEYAVNKTSNWYLGSPKNTIFTNKQ